MRCSITFRRRKCRIRSQQAELRQRQLLVILNVAKNLFAAVMEHVMVRKPQKTWLPRARTVVALAAVLIYLGSSAVAMACPSCKEALASSSGGGDLVTGFFWSILFLLSMPFLLLGCFGVYFYFLVRKMRATRVAAEQ